MTKPRTVKPAPKEGSVSKAKIIRAVASSTALSTGKSVESIEVKLKAKKPTLKEQVLTWQGKYVQLHKSNEGMLEQLLHKDMEIDNLKQQVSTLENSLLDEEYKNTDLLIAADKLVSRIEALEYKYYTPWYTKFINFLKGA